jgi:hypothetical protein
MQGHKGTREKNEERKNGRGNHLHLITTTENRRTQDARWKRNTRWRREDAEEREGCKDGEDGMGGRREDGKAQGRRVARRHKEDE